MTQFPFVLLGLQVHYPGGGGGALRNHMETHRQMAVRSRSGERQNLGAVRSFLGKKWAGQLYTKNTDGAVTYKVYLFSLYFVILMIFIIIESFVEEFESLVYKCVSIGNV